MKFFDNKRVFAEDVQMLDKIMFEYGLVGYRLVTVNKVSSSYEVFFTKETDVSELETCSHCDYYNIGQNYCEKYHYNTILTDVCENWKSSKLSEEVQQAYETAKKVESEYRRTE